MRLPRYEIRVYPAGDDPYIHSRYDGPKASARELMRGLAEEIYPDDYRSRSGQDAIVVFGPDGTYKATVGLEQAR